MSESKLPQFAFGYNRGSDVSGVFLESLLRAVVYDLETWRILRGRIVPKFCAHYLNLGRNELMTDMLNAYAHECPVMVLGDTDHRWEPEQLMHLVACCTPETPIVSTLYWAVDDWGRQVRPVMLRRLPNENCITDWEYPADTMVERDVVGFGLCAIRTELLLEMRASMGDHWFDFDENASGKFMREDDAFCYRAQKFLGAKIHVHTGIQIAHAKTVLLEKADERRLTPPVPTGKF